MLTAAGSKVEARYVIKKSNVAEMVGSKLRFSLRIINCEVVPAIHQRQPGGVIV